MPAELISCGVALPRATASWAPRIRSGSICCSVDEGATAHHLLKIVSSPQSLVAEPGGRNGFPCGSSAGRRDVIVVIAKREAAAPC
jgi:hypothetical protein